MLKNKIIFFLIIIIIFAVIFKYLANFHTLKLSMQVTYFPKTITNYCQPIDIQFNLTNNGKKTFRFEEIKNKRYSLAIQYQNTSLPVYLKQGVNQLPDGSFEELNASIKDFDEIKPKETKLITIYSGENHGFEIKDGWKVYLTNILADFGKEIKQNGKYEFKVILIDNKTNKTIVQSNPFTVNINIFDALGKLKKCYLAK